MTEPEIADFQANLLTALYELEKAADVRSRLSSSPGEAYLQAADDEMIEVAAALVKTWGRIDRPRHLQDEANA
jgi:hypothetical protein